jgi:hypothetical protein
MKNFTSSITKLTKFFQEIMFLQANVAPEAKHRSHSPANKPFGRIPRHGANSGRCGKTPVIPATVVISAKAPPSVQSPRHSRNGHLRNNLVIRITTPPSA